MQTRYVVFPEQGKVEVQSEPVAPVEGDRVLVKGHRSLISTGTENIVLNQLFEPGTHWARIGVFPFHPGYGYVGTVEAVGERAQKVKPGQRVFCRGKHRDYAMVPERLAYPVPEGVSDEEATFGALGKIVMHGVLKAGLKLGEDVVVVGQGLLGQLVTQYAYASGAGRIICIDPAAPRLELSKQHGATHTFACPIGEAIEPVMELTDGKGADVVFEMTGHPAVFTDALKLPRKFGRFMLVGDTGRPSEQRLTFDVVTRDITIIGAHDSGPSHFDHPQVPYSNDKIVEVFFRLVEQGRVRVRDLITHRYPLSQAPDAYEMLNTRRDEAMGVIFTYEEAHGG